MTVPPFKTTMRHWLTASSLKVSHHLWKPAMLVAISPLCVQVLLAMMVAWTYVCGGGWTTESGYRMDLWSYTAAGLSLGCLNLLLSRHFLRWLRLFSSLSTLLRPPCLILYTYRCCIFLQQLVLLRSKKHPTFKPCLIGKVMSISCPYAAMALSFWSTELFLFWIISSVPPPQMYVGALG